MGSELSQPVSNKPAPSAEELNGYLHLSTEEIARLVLCLMIEEALKGHLSSLPEAVSNHVSRHFGQGNGSLKPTGFLTSPVSPPVTIPGPEKTPHRSA
jgi:hypothetical protein